MTSHSDKLATVRIIITALCDKAERTAYDLRVASELSYRDGAPAILVNGYRERATASARTYRLLSKLLGILEGRAGSAVYSEALEALENIASDTSN